MNRAADLLKGTTLASSVTARMLAREPDSLAARTLKLWGDDENPFKRLIISKSADARLWRETMALILRNLRPASRLGTVWRGWYYICDRARNRVMGDLEESRSFTNFRVGMSATRSRDIACRPAFLNEHGALWEIRCPKSARDLEPIFRAIGAKYPEQRELIFPRGTRLALCGNPGWKAVRRNGQTLKVRHYVLEEVK